MAIEKKQCNKIEQSNPIQVEVNYFSIFFGTTIYNTIYIYTPYGPDE